MCLILLAWQAHPDFPLVVAANRDEFFARPTRAADYWEDAPDLLAGRDLEAGGTWLGITRAGRFAALTNFRDPARQRPDALTRGALVADYLGGTEAPAAYRDRVQAAGARWNGFNLLCGTPAELHYASNCGGRAQQLDPGVYGLSNHLLDTPWPKVAAGKSALAAALGCLPEVEPLFELLRDDRTWPDEHLPRTGVSQDWERLLSAAFVRSPDYGTRSSTVLLCARDGSVRLRERSFLPDAAPGGEVQFEFALTT